MGFIAVKDEWVMQECEHPMCERFHKNGCPQVKRVEWFIADSSTGLRTDINYLSGLYDRKRDALEAIRKYNGSSLTTGGNK